MANFRLRNSDGAASLRKPACAILVFSLPTSFSFLGCSGLASAGEAISHTRATVSVDMPRRLASASFRRRMFGSLNSSSRCSAVEARDDEQVHHQPGGRAKQDERQDRQQQGRIGGSE